MNFVNAIASSNSLWWDFIDNVLYTTAAALAAYGVVRQFITSGSANCLAYTEMNTVMTLETDMRIFVSTCCAVERPSRWNTGEFALVLAVVLLFPDAFRALWRGPDSKIYAAKIAIARFYKQSIDEVGKTDYNKLHVDMVERSAHYVKEAVDHENEKELRSDRIAYIVLVLIFITVCLVFGFTVSEEKTFECPAARCLPLGSLGKLTCSVEVEVISIGTYIFLVVNGVAILFALFFRLIRAAVSRSWIQSEANWTGDLFFWNTENGQKTMQRTTTITLERPNRALSVIVGRDFGNPHVRHFYECILLYCACLNLAVDKSWPEECIEDLSKRLHEAGLDKTDITEKRLVSGENALVVSKRVYDAIEEWCDAWITKSAEVAPTVLTTAPTTALRPRLSVSSSNNSGNGRPVPSYRVRESVEGFVPCCPN